jgi:Family of unknown function (DUF6463)
MLRIAGFWWIAVSIIHGLVALIAFFEQWQAIAQDGWFNVIAPDPLHPIYAREDALWLMMLTPFLWIVGRVCLWANSQSIALPKSIGVLLLATVLIGAFLDPISGIWLCFPPSVMMLWGSEGTPNVRFPNYWPLKRGT